MRRPRWLLALLLALVVAAGFAALGRWQLGRAVVPAVVSSSVTETTVSLTRVAKPGGAIRTAVIGQRVAVTGSFVPHDYDLVAERRNNGATGYWVVAHFTLAKPDARGKPVALAVARGWAPTKSSAQAAMRALEGASASRVRLHGRLLPSEAPVVPPPGADVNRMSAMSTAALYNLWSGIDGTDVYEAYVVQRHAPAGLSDIYSPPPILTTTINWLNIFYAVEWAVFAGFAIYLWYRLVRDTWEREMDEREDGGAGPRNGP